MAYKRVVLGVSGDNYYVATGKLATGPELAIRHPIGVYLPCQLGNPHNNAPLEAYRRTLQTELLPYGRLSTSIQGARLEEICRLDNCFSPDCRYSALG